MNESDQVWKLLERSEKKCVFKKKEVSEEILGKELARVQKKYRGYSLINDVTINNIMISNPIMKEGKAKKKGASKK